MNFMKKIVLIVCLALCSCVFLSCGSDEENSFPALRVSVQKDIVEDLSAALNDLAQASIPIGGDAETEWAAYVVDSLHSVILSGDRPFLEQMTMIHRMNGYFAYGLNYYQSVVGAGTCPAEASYARYSGLVCDSLANNAALAGYKDVMAIADLSCHTYYYMQLYLTLLNKNNGYEDYENVAMSDSFLALSILRSVNEAGTFTESELAKIYLVLDAVCFYKAYFTFVMDFLYDEKDFASIDSRLSSYAVFIDEAAATVFDAIYAETPTSLEMSDRDFEKFMKTVTDIKVDMITILADSFRAIDQAKQLG